MLPIDDASRDALDGSRPADQIIVWAWYDGALAWPEPLNVQTWQQVGVSDPSTKVQQEFNLTVADPDHSLAAWLFDDPLGVGGVELEVRYQVGGGGQMNRGRFRIEYNEPEEQSQSYVIDEHGYIEPESEIEPHKRRIMVPTGGVVNLRAVDLTVNADRDRLLAPESPPGASPTVLGEFNRLCGSYFPVVVDDGVTDRAVSKKLIYDRERLEAGQDLLASIDARYRMGGDGECHVYPIAPGPVVWRVEPTAGLVKVQRAMTAEGLYNIWVVEGKEDAAGRPVIGTATLARGPLRVDGPHGRVPFFYTSEMITTKAQALNYAISLRDRQGSKLALELKVITLPRPEIQAGDRIEVGCPVAAGHVAYIPGEVVRIVSGGDPTPGPMEMTVSCSYADVTAALGRSEWTANLTSTRPPLTWGRLRPTWGSMPELQWT